MKVLSSLGLLAVLAGLLAAAGVAAQAGHEGHGPGHADAPSVHGMAVVGKGKVYVSHLPMFHSPHDYQLIAEVALDAAGLAAYQKSVTEGTELLHTIEPEHFVLPEMVENPQPFRARLYKGHFERGGQVVAEAVTVKLVKVLLFKKFQPGAVKPDTAQYFLFGEGKEKFLAHEIVAKPDFDQILAVETDAPAGLVTAFGYANQPLKLGTGLSLLPSAGHRMYLANLGRQFYFETGDLSH